MVFSFCVSSCGYERGFELHGIGHSSCGRVVVVDPSLWRCWSWLQCGRNRVKYLLLVLLLICEENFIIGLNTQYMYFYYWNGSEKRDVDDVERVVVTV